MFRDGLGRSARRCVRLRSSHRASPIARLYSTSSASQAPFSFSKPSTDTSSLEAIEKCPDPTCQCAPTPELNPAVDVRTSLRETAPGYYSHVVIATGKSDWASKIETDSTVGLAQGLKDCIGRGGRYFDPTRPVLVTNSSFSKPQSTGVNQQLGSDRVGSSSTNGSTQVSTSAKQPESSAVSAFVFPEGLYIAGIPDTPAGHEAFLRSFVANGSKSPATSRGSLRPGELIAVVDKTSGIEFRVSPVDAPTVLICSHMSRDSRCGILGPLLHREFEHQLRRLGVATQGPSPLENPQYAGLPWTRVNIAMSSHVGGHRWAGNVIINFPEGVGAGRPLDGKAVWYGRVEPRHVEGIIKETIMSGKIIDELSRGVRC